MGLTAEELAELRQALGLSAPSQSPAEPVRVLQQSPPAGPPPTLAGGVTPEQLAGAVSAAIAAAMSQRDATDPLRQLAAAAPVPHRPAVTNVPAAAGSAPSTLRDPYALTQDDVNTMVRARGWHQTGTQIMEALRKAPPRRLAVRRGR